ncbi:MAG TPA: ADP-forming succinate--CoA ligase subunit beta [candidate division Zixibacteria bacterium]|nr:ADP-forming succinate--CoA ligase subunit beta [candidate division Zixibacteria bacterium]
MKLHEYQAKELFRRFGCPVEEGKIATTPEEAEAIAKELGTEVVVKAQVLVGGRGKAGGIKIAKTPEEARKHAEKILGMEIKGLKVKKVLVTRAVDIKHEAYLGAILDRRTKKVVMMASPEGGVDIEEVARRSPEKIFKIEIDPFLGLKPYGARYLMEKIYDDPEVVKQGIDIAIKIYNTFIGVDASLAEVNPLVLTPDGRLVCVDAKIVLDDNGLIRHPEFLDWRDPDEYTEDEVKAKDAGLSFVKLTGDIGCVVNGAGLAMATMDLIKHYGGEPANFLDVGGSSNPQKVVTALDIITRDPHVKVIFFNIFGGITRCDDIANGIIQAIEQFKPKVPIIARLVGTNQEQAHEILKKAGIPVFSTMDDVVKEAVKIAKTG